ncbi:NAD(P)-dependent oxidoreductase [Oricola sp.]|uniref:NAD(P)-dependent oxidoreductase n=1 Tax=Oricola sp. TaxID=1979950 RepID=UPI0025ED16B9|nr:NAD(P)-dependent oxidoreductase [Oricola sp.]MCI5075104.1 NAD(P)-dependent oxidoreductase [Oricola sp.]
MMRTVGLIGVGRMGHGIALNLLKAEFPLVFLDHPGNQPTDDLRALGAMSKDCAADVAAACDVIILVVTGAPEVEAVLTGPDGVLEGLRPGALVVDCSTSLPETTRAMARRVQEAGGSFLDAPMTRTPKEAAQGRLNLIVGGDAALLEAHKPMLESFAENIVHAGDTGSGHAMKLLHNFVSLGFSVVLIEAAIAARESGVVTEVFCDVLEQGGGRGVVLDRLAPAITDGDNSGLNFSIANAAKDMRYFGEMARSLGLPADVAQALARYYEQPTEAGQGELLVPELLALS